MLDRPDSNLGRKIHILPDMHACPAVEYRVMTDDATSKNREAPWISDFKSRIYDYSLSYSGSHALKRKFSEMIGGKHRSKFDIKPHEGQHKALYTLGNLNHFI
jgi:hypothetical protein